MSIFQMAGFSLLLLFYGSYVSKALLQKRRGINAGCLGLGQKEAKVRVLEIVLKISSYCAAALQVWAVFSAAENRGLSFFLGLSFALIGCCLLILAIKGMHTNWSIDLEAKTSLVTEGIYRFSRNPVFLGFDLFYIGFALCFPLPSLRILSAFMPFLFHLQILEEEKFLSKNFGEEYEAYKKCVKIYF